MNNAATTAKLGIAGTLEFRDAQGNIIKTVQVTGSIPLENLMPEVGEQDDNDGDNDCE